MQKVAWNRFSCCKNDKIFSTAHFSKFLELIVGQHSEKWLILRLNSKVQKHTKYQRRGVLYANTHVLT